MRIPGIPGGPLHLRRGKQGEALALDHLRDQGLNLLARNYRSPWGEIDLVMRDARVTVFVEVRLRAKPLRADRYPSAAETIGARKRQRLTRTAQHYLQNHRNAPARFDVVAITTRGDETDIAWIKDAFQHQERA